MANEKRLISADVAKEMIINHANEFSDVLSRREKALLIGGGTSCIDKCPTVDAVPVVHGRWDKYRDDDDDTCSRCTACGWHISYEDCTLEELGYNYCPNCGAKMDGDGNG